MESKPTIPAELDQLLEKTKEAFNRLQVKRSSSFILPGAGFFLACLLLIVLLEQALFFSPIFKTALWIFAIAGGLSLSYFFYHRQEPCNFNDFYTDYTECSAQPGLKYAFDLREYPRNADSRFFSLALQQNLDTINRQTFSSSLDQYVTNRPDHKRFIFFSLINSAVFILTLALLFSYRASFTRTLNFWHPYTAPNPYSFDVSPGDITMEQGQNLIPSVKFHEENRPDELTLAVKTKVENNFRKRSPVQVTGTQFSFAPIPLNTDASYYFEMDGHRSKTFTATVQLRPRFESLSVAVTPPPYTQLDSTRYNYPFSRITAYPGSQIEVSGQTNKEVASLYLVYENNGDSLGIESQNSRFFNYRWRYSQPDTLHFSMKDASGLHNKNPFTFFIDPIKDQAPFVQFIIPQQNIEQKSPAPLLLQYKASDDFGISSTRLHYTVLSAFSNSAPQEYTVPLSQANRQFNWDVTSLSLKPRDTVTFWIEVADNDRISGPKISSTRRLTLSISSITEYLDELTQKEQDVDKRLEDVSESYRQMQEEYDRFKEQLKRDPEESYEHRQNLKEVENKQNEVQDKVDELNKKFEELRKELGRDSLVSKETSQAYDELQKLMEEIDDPALQKALQELQDSMNNLSPQQLRQAMENFEFNEQQYKERIRRTLELFKKLKLNSELDKVAKAFEELGRQEQQLSNEEALPVQSKKQQAIQKDARKLQGKIDSLSVNAPQNAASQIQQLQKQASDSLRSVYMNLDQNIKQLNQKNAAPSTRQQQQQIENQFNQLAEKMRSAKQSIGQQQMQVNVRGMRYILYSLLNLSEHQETLTQHTETLTARSRGFIDKAREQQNIGQQFDNLSDSLFSLSAEIPRFSNAINEKKARVQQQLSSAINQLSERNKSTATFSQRQSLGGMNELASMVASLLRQIENQQGGAGSGALSMQQLMEQMQKMSGMQQKLNQQIQDYINDIQGNRLSNDQIERLNQMARQQNAIRNQLKELQESGQLQDGDRVLSDLQRMAEKMEQTINDLRGGQTDELLIERQKNILSRMLSAEKALQERDKEDKREGTSAKETPESIPPDVTLEQLQQHIRDLLNDPEQTSYSDDYQKLIEQYFKLLQEMKEQLKSSEN